MKHLFLIIGSLIIFHISHAQNVVRISSSLKGDKLLVDGKSFIINGMNWDYFPRGTNYSYVLWNQADDFIAKALDSEMKLLKDMGVNAIRVYTGIQPKWIEYIYENYGIYTMLNHSFGRYGLSLDGNWVPNTDYSNPKVEKILISEIEALAKEYKNIPGLLMYLLGNENNYGLFWEGAETEDIPISERSSTKKAIPMYKLFNKAAKVIKEKDKNHPVAICNGDLMFLDIIKEECTDVDIFGTNVYRGVSFTDTFEKVKRVLNKPIMFTEFGADAFNVIQKSEDEASQAYYLKENWKEIYQNVSGLGKSGNSIGGFTFQFSDGWWKFGQENNLDVHDNNASWANAGYSEDFIEGSNNMNEEWFGICAKGPTTNDGLYKLSPRLAYYVLKEVHRFNPYKQGVSKKSIDNHFSNIDISDINNGK